MRRSFFILFLVSVLLVVFSSQFAVHAGSKPPAFLELPPDARTRALGNGLVGLAETGGGKFLNPGSFSSSTPPEVHSLYEPGFDQYSSVSLSFNQGNYGLAYRGIGTGEIIERDLYGQPTGDVFRYHGHGLIGGLGKEFGDFGLGVSVKAYHRSSSDSLLGYSVTPGILYERKPFRVGAVLPDLLVSDPFEFGTFNSGKKVELGVGVSTEPLNLGLDVKAKLAEGELDVGFAGAGLEWWLSEIFALRVGTAGEAELTFGFGIRGGGARIDYAYSFHQELPDSYVVSVGWVFE
ncbi:MAG: hypothetical protein ACLFTO_06665 [Candidatus Acetothermia bacterium]